MKKRTRTAVVALAALAALALAAAATAAYTSPKLSVTYAAGNVTRIVASSAVSDDSDRPGGDRHPERDDHHDDGCARHEGRHRARRRSAPSRSAARCCRSPGDIIVAPPGAVTPTSQAQCTRARRPSATLLLVLQAAGQTINLPAYIMPTSGAQTALGPAQLVFCLPPPDIPVDKGGATFGAKFLSADLTLNGVFGSGRAGCVGRVLDAVERGRRHDQPAGTVASPAAIAPGGDHAHGPQGQGRRGASPAVSRRRGAGVATRVRIFGARARKRLATVVRRRRAARSRYAVPRAVEGDDVPGAGGRRRPERADRSAASSASLGVPCVNPTVSGFTATSRSRHGSARGTSALERAPPGRPFRRAPLAASTRNTGRGGDRPHRHVLAGPTRGCSGPGTRAASRRPRSGCATTPSGSTRSRSTRRTTRSPTPR